MKSPEIVFRASLTYLMEMAKSHGIPPEVVVDRLVPVSDFRQSISQVYERLLQSIANRNMMSSVIGFNVKKGKEDIHLVDRKKVFAKVLKGYDPIKILRSYNDADQIFDALFSHSVLHVNSDKNKLWRDFSRGALSGAKFLSEFVDINDLNSFLSQFSIRKELRLALPLYIANEIDGLGFALACDFLKEIGEIGYPKPDVQLRRFFTIICNYEARKVDDYVLCKDIIAFVEYLEAPDVSRRIRHMMFTKYGVQDFPINCYSIDKVFWMLGSWKLDHRSPDSVLSNRSILTKEYLDLLNELN
jgi:hypothetical protein